MAAVNQIAIMGGIAATLLIDPSTASGVMLVFIVLCLRLLLRRTGVVGLACGA